MRPTQRTPADDDRGLWEKIVDTVREPMLVLDSRLRVISANDSFYHAFQVARDETEGVLIYDLGNRQWDIPRLRELLTNVLPENESFTDYEVEHEFEHIGRRIMVLNARRIDHLDLILLAIEDVTDRRRSQQILEESNVSLEQQIAQRIETLSILQDVAIAANEARTVAEAFWATLKRICDYNKWVAGHAYLVNDDGHAVSAGVWFTNGAELDDADRLQRFGAFQQATAEMSFQPGEGLIGHVLQSGEPRWIHDASDFDAWRRVDPDQYGLGAAIAFPVTVNDHVVAILECLSDRSIEPEPGFMEIMTNVGIQLGHLIERKRLERTVATIAHEQARHFGRELHDSVAQELTGSGMMIASLRKRLEQSGSPYADDARKIREHVRRAQEQVRRMSRNMMPVEVTADALSAALEELARSGEDMYGIECRFECPEPVTVRSNEKATHLYRIAQEAMHNAVKHGEPTRIEIQLATENRHVVLTIRDDGGGFTESRDARRGNGLRIMRHRADLIEGSLRIESEQGRGVTVTCSASETGIADL